LFAALFTVKPEGLKLRPCGMVTGSAGAEPIGWSRRLVATGAPASWRSLILARVEPTRAVASRPPSTPTGAAEEASAAGSS
jgi:hypothetical protein